MLITNNVVFLQSQRLPIKISNGAAAPFVVKIANATRLGPMKCDFTFHARFSFSLCTAQTTYFPLFHGITYNTNPLSSIHYTHSHTQHMQFNSSTFHDSPIHTHTRTTHTTYISALIPHLHHFPSLSCSYTWIIYISRIS